MQFLIVAFAALAAASPTLFERSGPCPAIDTPQCCQLDVEGIVDTPCETPDDASTKSAFEASCAKTGYTAMCCTLPLAGDGLLCSAP